MLDAAARSRRSPQDDHRSTRFALVAFACTVVATAMSVALYAIGRGVGAALRVDPGLGEPDHLIIVDVVWKTAVPLALGAVVLVLIARRSRRWTTIAIVAGAVVAAMSGPFVFTGAHDTSTGVLLSSMHAIGGLTCVVIGVRACRDFAVERRT